MCEINRQSRFDAWDRALRAGALGWPWGMGWGGRWEGGSGWGFNFLDSFFLSLFLFQFSHSVMSDSLRPNEQQHTRPPCPSPTPGVHPNPCPWVGDAIQPSHPLLSPSPPVHNLSQHQGLLKWVSSSHQVAKVLEFQLQHQSHQWHSFYSCVLKFTNLFCLPCLTMS